MKVLAILLTLLGLAALGGGFYEAFRFNTAFGWFTTLTAVATVLFRAAGDIEE